MNLAFWNYAQERELAVFFGFMGSRGAKIGFLGGSQGKCMVF